ncbi:hypothetical protein PAXRUDRAFT_704438 [Paxillus rubicundulus Ve08.2h10]|uniref:Uncharacterized protein n=1 Tax=Paxillus rubicundulus Ve08.2h10 TaxID=930991 RepID=A0A0D0CKM3_9AGAM|nr:hypothetical protein PAXRUDRAFT_704438 [Paxillus rubicundulus Ve08.2h10]
MSFTRTGTCYQMVPHILGNVNFCDASELLWVMTRHSRAKKTMFLQYIRRCRSTFVLQKSQKQPSPARMLQSPSPGSFGCYFRQYSYWPARLGQVALLLDLSLLNEAQLRSPSVAPAPAESRTKGSVSTCEASERQVNWFIMFPLPATNHGTTSGKAICKHIKDYRHLLTSGVQL